MTPEETIGAYYDALREGEALAPFFVESPATVKVGLSERLVGYAEKAGANCIVTACPLCQTNLDMIQWRQKKQGRSADMPVFFLSELLALALGAKIGRREWRKHFVRPESLLRELSIEARA